MYCWGRATQGQLGLGGIEETAITTPRWNKFLHSERVANMGCGLKHTVILLDDGTMVSCGSNEKGQLGQDGPSTRPGLITALDSYRITQVACGDAHSVAIDDNGTLFTWGDNSFGQLGVEDGKGDKIENKFFPTRVKSLQGSAMIQVACGANHTLALSQSGFVHSWGENLHGQLGHSEGVACVKAPQSIQCLTGLPLVQLAAGGSHNLVLTHGQRVYGWGRNNFRQLGLSHNNDVPRPTEVNSLSSEGVRFISCGDSHTAVLNQNGEVLTFGCASSGQLGHGVLVSPNSPVKVTELLAKDILQVICGRMHTLAVDSEGIVYCFGQGSGGQLGVTKTANITTPIPIDQDWSTVPPRSGGLMVSFRKSCLMMSDSLEEESESLSEGECEKSMEEVTMVIPPEGTSVDPPGAEPMDIDEQYGPLSHPDPSEAERESVCPNISMVSLPRTESQDSTMVADSAMVAEEVMTGRLTRVFAGGDQSFACISAVPAIDDSSLTCCLLDFREHTAMFSKVKDETDMPSSEDPHSPLLPLLQCACSLNLALLPDGARVSEDDCCVEMTCFEGLFTKLWNVDNGEKLVTLVRSQLLPSLPTQVVGVESLRVFYILPVLLQKRQHTDSLIEFIKVFRTMHKASKISSCLGNWFFKKNCRDHLKATVKMAKNILHQRLMNLSAQLQAVPPPKIPPGATRPFIQIDPTESTLMITLLDFLQVFNKWNGEHGYPLKYTEFHEELIFELVDLLEDFFMWLSGKAGNDSLVFCRYPFILDARAKEQLMMFESRIQMKMAVTHAQTSNAHSVLYSQMLSDPSPHAYQLFVDRRNLIKDTMAQLVTSDALVNFKKPLVVTFIGEEGEDAGGVKKEFFTLLLQEILSPDFGMFVEDDESHILWFRNNYGLFEVESDHYVLIGILCGLAMYNSVIIDIPFPNALYKKLLGWNPDLSDLLETFPTVGHSLMDVVNYEGNDFVKTFDLNFSLTRSVFGELITIDLVKDGSNKVVTMENKSDYCAAYVDYIFNSSIGSQFEAFRKGFLKVCDGKVLRMILPEELKTLMVGKPVVHWEELEKYMSYKNGYSPSHPTIRTFWEVFNEFTDDLKKKFLTFYTGSNRIPIAGVKSMNMLIQKMDGGPKCNKLPVAHTCFNVLDLPPYETKAKMKEKLLQAINFTSGFGIV